MEHEEVVAEAPVLEGIERRFCGVEFAGKPSLENQQPDRKTLELLQSEKKTISRVRFRFEQGGHGIVLAYPAQANQGAAFQQDGEISAATGQGIGVFLPSWPGIFPAHWTAFGRDSGPAKALEYCCGRKTIAY